MRRMTGGSGRTRLDPADDAQRAEAAYSGGAATRAEGSEAAAYPPGAVPLPAALARADEAPFVGRGAALRRLRDGWQRGSGVAASPIVVTGEPGIGKTRLVARFAAE